MKSASVEYRFFFVLGIYMLRMWHVLQSCPEVDFLLWYKINNGTITPITVISLGFSASKIFFSFCEFELNSKYVYCTFRFSNLVLLKKTKFIVRFVVTFQFDLWLLFIFFIIHKFTSWNFFAYYVCLLLLNKLTFIFVFWKRFLLLLIKTI